MRFAICNETFVDWPFDRAFACARECGYAGIEIAPFTMATNVRDIPLSQRDEVRGLADANDLEIVGLHWLLAKTDGYYLTSPDAAVRKRTAEYLAELVRLCYDLGGSVMVLGSPKQRNLLPGVTHEQAVEYAADVLRQAVPAMEDFDVTLAVEPLGPKEGDFLNTADLSVQLIEKVGANCVRLHLDTKAMSTEAISIPDNIRTHAHYLAHFHANDPNMLGPGMGDLDFVPIFQSLGEIDYRGWVSVEVFDYSPGAEVIGRQSMEYMLACLEKLSAGK